MEPLDELREEIIKKRRDVKEAGRHIWILTILAGLIVWAFWKWYAILIAVFISVIAGSLYSIITVKKIQKRTGFDIHDQKILLLGYVPDNYLYKQIKAEILSKKNEK